jgi:hypothetical protein
MTKEFPMTNDQSQREGGDAASTPIEKGACKRAQTRTVWHRLHSSFRIRHSLGIRNSSFVIPCFALVARLVARPYLLKTSGNLEIFISLRLFDRNSNVRFHK